MAARTKNWRTNLVRRPIACGRFVPRPSRALENSSILIRLWRDPMSKDQRDEALFDGFESLTPAAASSQRAVERTRDSLLRRVAPCEAGATQTATLPLRLTSPPRQASFPLIINAKHPSRSRLLAYCGLAASLVLTVCFGVHYMAKQDRVNSVALTDASNPNKDLQHADFGSERSTKAATPEKEAKARSKSLARPADKALLDTAEYA